MSTSNHPNRGETRAGLSFASPIEANTILDILEKLRDRRSASGRKLSVGVISGYSAQVEHLTTRIDPDNSSRWRSLDIEVATVDSFRAESVMS